MKLFKIEDYVKLENPTPGEMHRPEILLSEHNAKALGGMLGLLPAGCQVPYHFHKNRESIIIFISGEGIEVIEGEESPVKAGDVLFIPAGEKHTTKNVVGSALGLCAAPGWRKHAVVRWRHKGRDLSRARHGRRSHDRSIRERLASSRCTWRFAGGLHTWRIGSNLSLYREQVICS